MLKFAKQPSLYVSPRMNHCWITRRNDDVNDEVTMWIHFLCLWLPRQPHKFSIIVKITKKCLSFSIFQHAQLFHDLGLGPLLQKEIALSKRTRSCVSACLICRKSIFISTWTHDIICNLARVTKTIRRIMNTVGVPAAWKAISHDATPMLLLFVLCSLCWISLTRIEKRARIKTQDTYCY